MVLSSVSSIIPLLWSSRVCLSKISSSASIVCRHRPLKEWSQTGHCGGLEEGRKRQFRLHRLAHTGNDLRCPDRVSAQMEKIILDTNALDSQNLRPYGRQSFFCLSLGSNEFVDPLR